MTSREIILAVFSERGSSVPGLSFSGDKVTDIAAGGAGNPNGYSQKRWSEGCYEYYDDRLGNIWKRINTPGACQVGEIHRPALKEWSDFANFQLPRYDRDVAAETMRHCFAAAPEKFHQVWMSGWIFADARYLRQMDNYLMDMALYPEELHRLHRKLAEMYRTLIQAAGDAKANAIVFCEDMGTQKGLLFSPAMWDEYFRDLYTELFSLAHERGMKVMMHSCGQNWEILERLLIAGVDCFQFDQPRVYDFADLSALLRRFNAVLWSPIDIQKVLPTGNRALIESEADAMQAAFKGKIIFKEYPDLPGIGIKPEWNDWGYEAILAFRQNH